MDNREGFLHGVARLVSKSLEFSPAFKCFLLARDGKTCSWCNQPLTVNTPPVAVTRLKALTTLTVSRMKNVEEPKSARPPKATRPTHKKMFRCSASAITLTAMPSAGINCKTVGNAGRVNQTKTIVHSIAYFQIVMGWCGVRMGEGGFRSGVIMSISADYFPHTSFGKESIQMSITSVMPAQAIGIVMVQNICSIPLP